MYRELFRKEIQERVYGCVTVDYNSFIGGYEIRIGTPNLYFSSFITDGDIERCKNPITLVEQVMIKRFIKLLYKKWVKGNCRHVCDLCRFSSVCFIDLDN